jgi:hypothetical protein
MRTAGGPTDTSASVATVIKPDSAARIVSNVTTLEILDGELLEARELR